MLICGLPGSGKSTLAERLAPRLGAERFSSDQLRAELGLRGDYGDAAIDTVYRELVARATRASAAGRRVVLDATFSSARHREAALSGAERVGARSSVVEVTADEATTLKRVDRQRRFSEAREGAYRLLRGRFDPITQPHLTLDSSTKGVETLVEAVVAYLA